MSFKVQAKQSTATPNTENLVNQLKSLNAQIKDPKKSSDPVATLKRNLAIKERMIAIAKQIGEPNRINELSGEASAIRADIAKNTGIITKKS